MNFLVALQENMEVKNKIFNIKELSFLIDSTKNAYQKLKSSKPHRTQALNFLEDKRFMF